MAVFTKSLFSKKTDSAFKISTQLFLSNHVLTYCLLLNKVRHRISLELNSHEAEKRNLTNGWHKVLRCKVSNCKISQLYFVVVSNKTYYKFCTFDCQWKSVQLAHRKVIVKETFDAVVCLTLDVCHMTMSFLLSTLATGYWWLAQSIWLKKRIIHFRKLGSVNSIQRSVYGIIQWCLPNWSIYIDFVLAFTFFVSIKNSWKGEGMRRMNWDKG